MAFASAAEPLCEFTDKIRLRSVLSDADVAAIHALPVVPCQVDAHREIVHLGERLDHSCLVADGVVARFSQTHDGRRQLLALFIRGDMADLPSFMLPDAPAPMVALTEVTLFQIAHTDIAELIDHHPNIGTALWRESVIDTAIVGQWLVNVGRKSARARLAHLICELAWRYARSEPITAGQLPMPLTQEQIADALGLTSVHVNRSLKGLRDDGLVVVGRQEATILDWDEPAAEAEFDPAYLNLPLAPAEPERVAV
ncbi:MAG: Crp/Fnr family transcriptional regulator [Sphingomonas sp.]|uniref:Crp/Fnr family transcriptional regulator n=1 Tax=Sphingomonas sp. TaxID=28214 RepID=UPI001AC4E157|nr:Crp/Fnr family transcriptional regulator [Sphingomonas sp.]MBN8806884.1 Crp/Fnr family transcriptional regulator [Sphingomonas sp.]